MNPTSNHPSHDDRALHELIESALDDRAGRKDGIPGLADTVRGRAKVVRRRQQTGYAVGGLLTAAALGAALITQPFAPETRPVPASSSTSVMTTGTPTGSVPTYASPTGPTGTPPGSVPTYASPTDVDYAAWAKGLPRRAFAAQPDTFHAGDVGWPTLITADREVPLSSDCPQSAAMVGRLGSSVLLECVQDSAHRGTALVTDAGTVKVVSRTAGGAVPSPDGTFFATMSSSPTTLHVYDATGTSVLNAPMEIHGIAAIRGREVIVDTGRAGQLRAIDIDTSSQRDVCADEQVWLLADHDPATGKALRLDVRGESTCLVVRDTADSAPRDLVCGPTGDPEGISVQFLPSPDFSYAAIAGQGWGAVVDISSGEVRRHDELLVPQRSAMVVSTPWVGTTYTFGSVGLLHPEDDPLAESWFAYDWRTDSFATLTTPHDMQLSDGAS